MAHRQHARRLDGVSLQAEQQFGLPLLRDRPAGRCHRSDAARRRPPADEQGRRSLGGGQPAPRISVCAGGAGCRSSASHCGGRPGQAAASAGVTHRAPSSNATTPEFRRASAGWRFSRDVPAVEQPAGCIEQRSAAGSRRGSRAAARPHRPGDTPAALAARTRSSVRVTCSAARSRAAAPASPGGAARATAASPGIARSRRSPSTRTCLAYRSGCVKPPSCMRARAAPETSATWRRGSGRARRGGRPQVRRSGHLADEQEGSPSSVLAGRQPFGATEALAAQRLAGCGASRSDPRRSRSRPGHCPGAPPGIRDIRASDRRYRAGPVAQSDAGDVAAGVAADDRGGQGEELARLPIAAPVPAQSTNARSRGRCRDGHDSRPRPQRQEEAG